MSLLRNIASGLRSLFRKERAERELDEELSGFLEMAAEEKMKQGMSHKDALRAVRLERGSVEVSKEVVRSAGWESFVETLSKDLRYGVRLLGRSPLFTIVATLSLALGIGANTAIFQLIDAVRLRTIPVKEPSQLFTVQLADRTGIRGSQSSVYSTLTNTVWEKLRDTQDIFSGALAWGNNNFNLTPGGEVRLAQGLFVSGDFFRVLGVQPLMGRVFTAADDRRGCGLPGAVVSYAFWQRELGGDPSAVGRKLTLNYHPTQIIGVTPPASLGLRWAAPTMLPSLFAHKRFCGAKALGSMQARSGG